MDGGSSESSQFDVCHQQTSTVLCILQNICNNMRKEEMKLVSSIHTWINIRIKAWVQRKYIFQSQQNEIPPIPFN